MNILTDRSHQIINRANEARRLEMRVLEIKLIAAGKIHRNKDHKK